MGHREDSHDTNHIVRSQMDRMEAMLQSIQHNLGIQTEAHEDNLDQHREEHGREHYEEESDA